MTAKERYDEIIQKIEEMVTTQRLQAKDIAEEIAWDQGMTYRDLATVLGFLTGEQLINYIRSRKYQAAYKFLSEAKERKLKMSIAISKALDIADMKEQSSLNKVFKKLFGITPGEAFYMQDASRTLPPKNWAEISNETTAIEEIEDTQEEPETIFGIDKALYERISRINDLEAFYGLSRDYSVVAVRLSDEQNIDLNDAFGYVEGFKAQRELILDDEDASKEQIAAVLAEDWLWTNASNPDMIYCCITCGISVSSALWLVQELTSLGHAPICSLSPYFIKAYQEELQIHSHFLRKACEYYESHIDDTYTDEDFEEFINQLLMNRPIEIAFENMQLARACDDDDFFAVDFTPEDTEVDETAAAFEAWAAENAGNHGPRFDESYDPDNPNYT